MTVAILILAFLLLAVYASSDISSGVYLKTFCRGNTDGKRAYLTFDDGPCSESTEKVLDILDRHGAKATFFVIGENCRKYPDTLKKIVERGHAVGWHTETHSWKYPFYGQEKMRREIVESREAVECDFGLEINMFRPPFGVTNPAIGQAVRNSGLKAVGWSIRTFDTSNRSPRKVAEKVASELKPGSVILLHDRLPEAPEILEEVLAVLEEAGYSIDKAFSATE